MKTNTDPGKFPAPSSEPSIEKIEYLLHKTQPNPSPRFYRQIKDAPWENQRISRLFIRWSLATTLIISLLVTALLISPPLRAMARNWLLYFWPNNQDQMQISLSDLNPQDIYQYTSAGNFPLSLSEAGEMAGFSTIQPQSLPSDLVLIGSRYEAVSHSIVTLYQGTGYNLFLSQRPADAGQEYFRIGASAKVEVVSIGGTHGELVTGGWVNLSDASPVEPGAPSDLEVVWDTTIPQFTLRWQNEGYIFQLRAAGSHSPQKNELIALAQTIH